MALQEPLLSSASAPTEAHLPAGTAPARAYGCVPCEKLLIWRGEGSNRTLWKCFCSAVLVAEIGFYVYLVYPQFPLLVLFACFSLVKFLVETWGQDTPNWICPGGVGMFLFIYVVIIPGLLLYPNGVCTRNQDITFPYHSLLGAVLFFGGSCFSLGYEVGRFRWKKDPGNKGRLHTVGLARFCIHPNYLGDLFTYSGWGLAAGTTCAITTPIFMVWSFLVFVCPNSDAYLAQRYWREWGEYEAKTATLIPGFHSKLGGQVLAWLAFGVGSWLYGNCAGQCG
eukprot:g1628.t1